MCVPSRHMVIVSKNICVLCDLIVTMQVCGVWNLFICPWWTSRRYQNWVKQLGCPSGKMSQMVCLHTLYDSLTREVSAGSFCTWVQKFSNFQLSNNGLSEQLTRKKKKKEHHNKKTPSLLVFSLRTIVEFLVITF